MKRCETCQFCEIIEGRYQYPEIDEPFKSNEEFVAMVSIGALVEGWMLIVPKYHAFSMKNFYNSPNLENIIISISRPLISVYGPIIAFEHGANRKGSSTGCGVDHAHLHLVPMGESLVPSLNNSGLNWMQCRPSEIKHFAHDEEYLFYTELSESKEWGDPMGYCHVLKYPISKFFRRLIANKKGNAQEADYNIFPYLNTAKQSRSVLSSLV